MDKELEFVVNEDWAKFKKENPWIAHVPEFAKDSKGQEFMRSLGRSVVYKILTEDGNNQIYECNNCGSEIVGATVVHSIHDGPFPGSGSGQCKYEQVPYCPNCEERPISSGAPIESGRKILGWDQKAK